MPTLLPLVRACQNDDPWADPTLHALRVDGVQIGFVPQCVLDAVREFLATEHGTSVLRVVDDAVSFANGASCAQRSEDMARLTAWMRDTRRFPDPLDGTPTPDAGWRNEAYAVYGPGADGARSAVVFTLERAACGLFGIATFGVHVTAYTPDHRIWVPRRSRTKQTWPGYLDNSVAGGITAGDAPRDTVVRECQEEAGLRAEHVEPFLKQTGLITYFYKTPAGWRQPEMQHVYDLALPSDAIELKPEDGEAESFELLDVPAVLERLHRGEFKANCALVLVDFFIRHGYVTTENEPHYAEIVALLHTSLRLPVM
ncbi:thiamine diphosphokinase [Malassezia obtusa]|uniref:Thiamine diphosphokinase n=1 Tax=Malassezia obtusa TaxID=76774 RepID=A0AAF0ITH0_9BASI|nr:thiamine diphosphokinase [Malassezia obtusa]